MRRKDKEITDVTQIEAILHAAPVCRIGMSGLRHPYIVPVNFGYRNKQLFVHSANKGLKLELMRKNPNVCFEIDTEIEIVKNEKACNFGTSYKSVIGFGTVLFVEKTADKIEGLNCIMEKYSPGKTYHYDQSEIDKIVMLKIRIESVTGKISGKKG
jgi:nitroimidazol reductase NimA-like FMN-containing flavoprotein (pyridoxamine 5'-phosphate oxidase superfamily)